MRLHKPLIGIACALALQLLARASQAAPPWVDRPLTLPSGDWAFDFGLGVGHVPAPVDDTAAGVNAEMAVGLTSRVELGLRTGLRFGDDADRAIEPDNYGRLFDRQYFDGGNAPIANPEVRVRWAFPSGSVGEMGLEGRFIAPLENN